MKLTEPFVHPDNFDDVFTGQKILVVFSHFIVHKDHFGATIWVDVQAGLGFSGGQIPKIPDMPQGSSFLLYASVFDYKAFGYKAPKTPPVP